MERKISFLALILAILMVTPLVWAADENKAQEQPQAQAQAQTQLQAVVVSAETQVAQPAPAQAPQQVPRQSQAPTQSDPYILSRTEIPASTTYTDPLRYTLGPDDVIEITVMRHTEFSGVYPVNLEGRIQYRFLGDIDVTGLTKKELEDKLKKILSSYVNNPEVSVTITEYRSKIIYVLGEVGAPGRYYMRSESIPVREAVVQAGLPTVSAAMRKCRIVTPTKKGRIKTRAVDLYAVLYGGNLKYNIDMHPGDVLYVPATIMAKVIRVISPAATTVGLASGGAENTATIRSAGAVPR